MLTLVCWTGFDFVVSCWRHRHQVIGDGVFFALALILAAAGAIEIEIRGKKLST